MRTWDENKLAIHEFWPEHAFTDEEAKLWREDLGSLDQERLYDAIKNTKRNNPTRWVHLKWISDEYKQLRNAKAKAVASVDRGEKLNLHIDADESQKLANQFMALIDISRPEDFDAVEGKVLDALPRMFSKTAVRVLIYARARLLGQRPQFGTVTSKGDVRPFNEVAEFAGAN